jgi:DNA modification methylase
MIYNEDCLVFLRKQADKSVDFVFYDPPYNKKKDYGVYKDDIPEEQYREWMQECVTESTRISRRGIAVYVGSMITGLFYGIIPTAHVIVVEKRAIGAMRANYFLQYHSLFSTARPIKVTKDLWDDVRLPGEGYFFREPRYDHPGLTSLELTRKVIYTFTEEGGTVADPFSGVGTTAVACYQMNREFIGSELNPEYIEVANQRLKIEKAQGVML